MLTRRSFQLKAMAGSAGLGLFNLPVAAGEDVTGGFKAGDRKG